MAQPSGWARASGRVWGALTAAMTPPPSTLPSAGALRSSDAVTIRPRWSTLRPTVGIRAAVFCSQWVSGEAVAMTVGAGDARNYVELRVHGVSGTPPEDML